MFSNLFLLACNDCTNKGTSGLSRLPKYFQDYLSRKTWLFRLPCIGNLITKDRISVQLMINFTHKSTFQVFFIKIY